MIPGAGSTIGSMMTPAEPRKRQPKSTKRGRERPARPRPGGSVQAGEVLTLSELKRRLGWGEHATRQARRAGLRLIAFGREKYALGADVLSFFARLAEQQAGSNGHQAAGREGERGTR